MSRNFLHGILSLLTLAAIAGFVIADGHATTQTVFALIAAALGAGAFFTLPTAMTAPPSPPEYSFDAPRTADGHRVLAYEKRNGTDGISTVRVWAFDHGAHLEITVNRLGTLAAPLSPDSALVIAETLKKGSTPG